MAVDCGAKENLPPAPAPVSAVVARQGIAVKKCRLKRFGRARRRAPLRDITNLFLVDPVGVVAEWEALQPPPREGSEAKPAAAAAAAAAAQMGLAGGAAAKAGRYSLRKEFR